MAINFSIPGLTIAPEEQFSQLVLVVSNLSVGISNMQTQLNTMQAQIAEIRQTLNQPPAPTPTPTPTPTAPEIIYHNAEASPGGMTYTSGSLTPRANLSGPGLSVTGLRNVELLVPQFDVSADMQAMTLYVDQIENLDGLLSSRRQGVTVSQTGELIISVNHQSEVKPVQVNPGDGLRVVMNGTRIGVYHQGNYYGHSIELPAQIDTPHLHIAVPGASRFDFVLSEANEPQIDLQPTAPLPPVHPMCVTYNCSFQDDIAQYIGGSLMYDTEHQQQMNAMAILADLHNGNQVFDLVVPMLGEGESIEIGLQSAGEYFGAQALQGRLIMTQNGEFVELTNDETELTQWLVPHSRIEIWFDANAQRITIRSPQGAFTDKTVTLDQPVEDAYASLFWYGPMPASALQLNVAPRGET